MHHWFGVIPDELCINFSLVFRPQQYLSDSCNSCCIPQASWLLQHMTLLLLLFGFVAFFFFFKEWVFLPNGSLDKDRYGRELKCDLVMLASADLPAHCLLQWVFQIIKRLPKPAYPLNTVTAFELSTALGATWQKGKRSSLFWTLQDQCREFPLCTTRDSLPFSGTDMCS